MVTVRATCPTCGDVEVAIADVGLQVCVTTSTASYSFVCPECLLIVSKGANDRVLRALSEAGATTTVWSMPAELAEPKLGPPITHDDLLAFHLALEEGDWVGELSGAHPNQPGGPAR